MRTLFKDNVIEALIGLAVLIVAVGFVVFAYDRTQAGTRSGGYELKAKFSNVAGVSPGTDVRVSGIKVGTVTKQELDTKGYQAELTFRVSDNVKLPIDSSAAITSEGLLGGTYISLTPGGDPVMMKPGAEILETSGSTDLMQLIGSYINNSGGKNAAPAAGAAATPPAK